jgi:hypothetical protein
VRRRPPRQHRRPCRLGHRPPSDLDRIAQIQSNPSQQDPYRTNPRCFCKRNPQIY